MNNIYSYVSEIGLENLNFNYNGKKYSKHVNRKLSSWIKGYIQERLEYKADNFNVLESPTF